MSSETDTKELSRRQAVEVAWPYTLGACGGVGIGLWASVSPATDSILTVFTATASALATFAGFMLAAAAILASIGDRPFIRQAKRAGVYSNLIHYLFVSMRWCIYGASISIPAVLYSPAWKLKWYPFALGIWGFVVLTSLFTSFRALRSFTKVMKYVSED